jgi:hypothetical protein
MAISLALQYKYLAELAALTGHLESFIREDILKTMPNSAEEESTKKKYSNSK